MYEHMKGGYRKKAPYNTVVIRLPEPLKAEVDRMISEFHEELVTSNQSEVDKKPVTGNNLVSEVQQIIKSIEGGLPGFKMKSAKKLVEAVLALKSYLK